MKTWALGFALFPVLACGSSSSGTSSSSSSSGGGGSGDVRGTVAGQAFTLGSGFARVENGTVDLILSNVGGVCDSFTANHVHAGEVIVQLYNMKGTAPGTFTTPEVKYAAVKTTCAAGAPVDDNGAVASRSKTAKVTIEKLGDTVDGTLDVTFEDGSTAAGSFSLPTCAAKEAEGATCI